MGRCKCSSRWDGGTETGFLSQFNMQQSLDNTLLAAQQKLIVNAKS